MPRLPHTVDFDDRAFPDLADIFRSIDVGIAAIVAADPTMRPAPPHQRRPRTGKPGTAVRRSRQAQRRAA